jgi:uncharacterized protein (DUF2235 family)
MNADPASNPPIANRAARRIILLSDGTGNSAAKLFRTNVWRLYQALDLSGAEQIARYDDGVGTSNFKPLAILGGAIGWGLKRNLLDLYIFLCRNYRKGDDIYAFGFSRGAFTIRVLVKFILSQGIVANFYSDDDLRWKSEQLYRNFRRERKTRLGLATAGRLIRDVFVWLIAHAFRKVESDIAVETPARIKFVGVWDTVDAYGLPVYELKKGIDRYLWPLALEDRVIDDRIEKACHAICMDDQRKTFHPLYWDESDAAKFPQVPQTNQEKLTQVFFVGVHSNVGGGYPDDGLSYVSLNWMAKEALKAGLSFDAEALRQIHTSVAPFGKLYDSRSGLAAYYRYEPRPLNPPQDVQSNCIPCPKIHESVLVRMAIGTDSYAPIELPRNARVIVESSWKAIAAGQERQANILTLDDYVAAHSDGDSAYPNVSATAVGTAIVERVKAVDSSSASLIWDTVWWRRVAYFSTVFVSIGLFASPLVSFLDHFPIFRYISAAFRMDKFPNILELLLSPIVRLAAAGGKYFLPGFLSPWIEAFRSHPSNFLTLSTLLVACLLWGALIDRRIRDRSLAAWDPSWSQRRAKWFEASLVWRYKTAFFASICATALFLRILLIAYHRPTCAADDIWCGIIELIALVGQVFIGALLLAIAVSLAFWFFALRRMIGHPTATATEPTSIALRAAHRIRNSGRTVSIFNWCVSEAVPALFAIAVVAGSIIALNWTSLAVLSAAGGICTPSSEPPVLEGPAIVVLDFSKGCQATGLKLESGVKYEITMQSDLDDPDPSDEPDSPETSKLRTELAKYPKNDPQPKAGRIKASVGVAFRRVLSAAWFDPVVQVGETGSQQYVIDPTSGLQFSPTRDGEAFLYLNNVVVGLPYVYDIFYRQKGITKISIKREEKEHENKQ